MTKHQTNKPIAILGCGWLGLPLAKGLLSLDYEVKGSTTSHSKLGQLSDAGISPFLIQLYEQRIEGDFGAFLDNVETVIIAFPPKLQKNPEANFVSKMTHFVSELEQTDVKQVLYVSSTSVFEDKAVGEKGFRIVTEETEPDGQTKKARQLIEGEMLLKEAHGFTTTIIRFGGLLGKERHPAKYLAGRKNLKNGDAPVNLIHLEDCLSIIELILEKQHFGGVFHGVNPIHQAKRDYYRFIAETMDLEKPEYDNDDISKGKVIYSQRLNTDLGFEFQNEI